jgi:TolB protein
MKKLSRLFILSWLCLAGAAHAAISIEIFGGAARKIPIAVMPFAQGANQPSGLTDIVGADLVRSGMFALADTRGAQPADAKDVDFTAWRERGADVMVIGRVVSLPGGRLEVRFRLLDMVKQTQLTGFSYNIAPEQWRATAHRIADAVYEQLLGVKGAFSSRIAYVQKQGKRFELRIADADGENPRVVMRSAEPIISPAWSPDGSKMVYVSFEDRKPVIYLQSLRDGGRIALANFKGSNSAPAWSPDGSKLAMVLTRDQGSQMYVMDIDTRQVTRLTHGGSIDTEPVWTPDGQALLFTSDRGGSPQIYRIAASGGEVRRLTFDGAYNVSPALSPDGKQLAFVRRANGGFHIAVQDLASGEMRVLTDTVHDESPSFAPNGQTIVYATRVGGRGVLATVSLDGKTRQRLSDTEADIREPVWSP